MSEHKLPPLVDWTQACLFPAPRAALPHRRETHYPVRCANPACGQVRWLKGTDARRAEAEQRICRRCQASLAGKRGYAMTTALYGTDFALKAMQQSQRLHPSKHEEILRAWLEELGMDFEFQVIFSAVDEVGRIHNFIIDFVVKTVTGEVAIEVNGYHHKKFRAHRDQCEQALWPGDIYFIDTDDIDTNPTDVKALLQQVVQHEMSLSLGKDNRYADNYFYPTRSD